MSAGPAAAGGNVPKLFSKTGTPGGFDALRLVLCTQPRSGKLARPATILGDTDRARPSEEPEVFSCETVSRKGWGIHS